MNALLTGEKVWIVTHTDRFGAGNFAFSTEEAANAFGDAFIRQRWTENHGHLPVPDDTEEMHRAYFEELEPDELLETDGILIDEAAGTCQPVNP